MKAKDKLREKLSKLLNLDFYIEIETFKGNRDAGAYRWFSTNSSPNIASNETLSELNRAKKLYYYLIDDNQIEISSEDLSKSTFFRGVEVNPKIDIKEI